MSEQDWTGATNSDYVRPAGPMKPIQRGPSFDINPPPQTFEEIPAKPPIKIGRFGVNRGKPILHPYGEPIGE